MEDDRNLKKKKKKQMAEDFKLVAPYCPSVISVWLNVLHIDTPESLGSPIDCLSFRAVIPKGPMTDACLFMK